MEGVWKWASKRSSGILLMISAMMCSLNAFLYLQWNNSRNYAIHCDDERRHLFEYDEFVKKSVVYWSRFANEPEDVIINTYYPNSVDLKNETCVGLSPLYSLGDVPVYCYDKKSKQPTYINQDVE